MSSQSHDFNDFNDPNDPNSHNLVNILVCFTGSVATVKVPEICSLLLQKEIFQIRIISSGQAANHFLERSKKYNPVAWEQFLKYDGLAHVVSDEDEWNSWQELGDSVLHIELRKWADIIVVAPASADILAKMSVGISDSLLLSVIRAWDFQKPCYLCPAMNTLMWDHPSTETCLNILQSWGWEVINPVTKTLACNEKGNGALASVSDIIEVLSVAAEKIRLSREKKDPSNMYESKILTDILIRKKKLVGNYLTNDHSKNIKSSYLSLFVLVSFALLAVGTSKTNMNTNFW